MIDLYHFMKKIYLDYNILVLLMNKSDSFLEDLISSIDKTKFQFVYSPAHIEEIAVSSQRNNYPIEKTNEKLEFLSVLTNNMEILPFMRDDVRIVDYFGAYLCEENPENCYARVVENYSGNDLAEELERKFLDDAEEKNVHGNDPNEMNNISPELILKEPIYDYQVREEIFMSLLSLRKYGKDRVRELVGVSDELPGFTSASIRKEFLVIQVMMQIVFNKLEEIRYRPEKKRKYRSRLHDVSHAIYATYCDYFITEDSRLADKAKAAYAYLRQETKVAGIKDFELMIST